MIVLGYSSELLCHNAAENLDFICNGQAKLEIEAKKLQLCGLLHQNQHK